MSFDHANAFFELGAAALLWLNVAKILREKKVAGVSVIPTAFFTLWGFFNLVYYPSIGQYWSAVAAGAVAVVNTIWVFLAIRYERAAVRELRDAVGRMARASRTGPGGVPEV